MEHARARRPHRLLDLYTAIRLAQRRRDTWALWLIAAEVVCALASGRGLDRKKGILVIAAYPAFVAWRIYLA